MHILCSDKLRHMDERAIKRLLVIVGVSLIAIVLFKVIMTRTIVNLNKVTAAKNQSVPATFPTQQDETPVSDTAILFESPAVSSTNEGITLEQSVVSGVSEAR